MLDIMMVSSRWFVRITVSHYDFAKATQCSFCQIMVAQRDSDKLILTPNIHLVYTIRSLTLEGVPPFWYIVQPYPVFYTRDSFQDLTRDISVT